VVSTSTSTSTSYKNGKKVTKIRKEYKYADGQTKVEEQEITENI